MSLKSTTTKLLNRSAFTLAEILITMAIIGTIAALTIPTLISYSQKTQYAAALKEAYSKFNQALQGVSTNHGCVNDLKCAGVFGAGTTSKTIGDEIATYFLIGKNCGMTPVGQGCLPANANNNFNGSSGSTTPLDTDSTLDKFTTAGGVSFAIMNNVTGCADNWSSTVGYMSQTCGYVYIDVNGLQGPNYLGRDIFMFFITNGKGAQLYPWGGEDDNSTISQKWWNAGGANNCSLATSTNGAYCTGRVVEKGWKIDY